MAAHQRKIELQSPADLTYLYANTVALSRKKLDLYFPPSATNDETPDPMRERVRELVDDVSRTILNPEREDMNIFFFRCSSRQGDQSQSQSG
jgi:kinetochor protein Mis14/NSL1